MERNKLSYRQAKQLSITEYLSGRGIEPTGKRGHDWWYISPFRDERTASFKVNIKLNLWYDHGIGEGGTILDLGAKLHRCSVDEFLLALEASVSLPSFHQPARIKKEPENKVEIICATELSDSALLGYLKFRGISLDVARAHCQEVDFKIGKSQYKAIGFPNRAGGYELRNSWLKRSASPKDISVIAGQPDKVAMFEGYMNFLSLLQIRLEARVTEIPPTVIVLNSAGLLSSALPIVQQAEVEVTAYLDNDPTGRKAKDKLIAEGVNLKDASTLYEKHKDLNEALMARNAASAERRSRRLKM